MKKIKKANSISKKNYSFLFVLLITFVVIIIYAKSSSFDFVNIDDDKLIYNNQLVTNNSIPYSECFERFLYRVHYKPFVFLTWKFEYQLFGDNPSHFHTINWILHLVNSILLFFITKNIFRRIYSKSEKSDIYALLLVLFFSANPLKIESVAWATERKDVLFSLFFLISWLSYLNYLKNGKFLFIVLGSLMYLFSGLSKSMALTLFGVLFLMDFLYNRKINYKIFLEKIPYLLVLILLLYLYGFFTSDLSSVISSNAGVSNPEDLKNRISSLEFINNQPVILQRLLSASFQFVLWAVHILLPIKLSISYSHDTLFATVGNLIFLFPFVIIIAFVWAWIKRKKDQNIIGAFLFYGFTLSPALLVSISGRAIFLADRYTYIPSIGIFFILIIFIDRIRNSKVRYILFLSIFLFYFGISISHVKNWKNTETLFTHSLKVAPESSLLYLGLGNYYLDQGNFSMAETTFSEGISYSPRDYFLHNNRGVTYMKEEKWEKALNDFNTTLEIYPNYPEALSNRGTVFLQLNMLEKLIEDYQKYLDFRPDDDVHYYRLGLAFFMLKDYNNALVQYSKAIDINANIPDYFLMRSYSNNMLGYKDKAVEDAIKARNLGYNLEDDYLNQLGIN